MKRISTIGLALSLSAAACNSNNASTAVAHDAEPEAAVVVEAPDAAASAAASASAGASLPLVRRRGLAGSFFRAAQDADLSDDQKTAIAKLEEPLQGEPGPRREMTALHADLVAGVKEGKIDASKIATDEAAVGKMLASREEEQATALAGLHDALTPAQRGLVADAVRAARERRPPPPPPADAPDWATRRLEHMKSQLVLDQDQQKQVAAVLARVAPTPAAAQAHYDALKKQTEAVATAFEKDTFDAKKVDLSAAPGKKVTDPFDRQVKYLTLLLPILTPGQRDRFASLMEHPRERGERGQGARGESITEAPDPASGPMR
jgi:Spy/CpxP family protein refolding chaperone